MKKNDSYFFIFIIITITINKTIMAASYEDQAYYIYEAIEELIKNDLENSYSLLILENKQLNKMHFEYLSEAIIEFLNDNNKTNEIIDIDNEMFIIRIKDKDNNEYLNIMIDLEFDKLIKEYMFRITRKH